MSNYSSQLRDRRWQKRRLEIMERDRFKCRLCDSHDETIPLHVHHIYYAKDMAVWEYPDDALITVCEECHDYITLMHSRLLVALYNRSLHMSYIATVRRAFEELSYRQLHEWLLIADRTLSGAAGGLPT
jgi:hypothetical protein